MYKRQGLHHPGGLCGPYGPRLNEKETATLKLSELLQGVEVLASTAPAAWEITGVAYDSRQVQPGNALSLIHI